eukprot:GHVS01045505.1.p1 GENE.GHVS01045505.1~~GHVS01045505.1.p1  ORF type:complete len:279 (+),score=36.85 GHVS01045505.1:284-1120(+)
MGNLCQKHTTPTTTPSPVSFSSAVVPTPTSNIMPSHGSSPSSSPIPSGSFGRGTALNGSSQGDDVGDGMGSLTVEHSSTSGYPVSLTTLSVTSESTRTYSPSTKCRNTADGQPEAIHQATSSSSVVPPIGPASAHTTSAAVVVAPNKTETPTYPSTAPPKSMSSVSLEPADQHRLRHFYARNLRAQKRHATLMAQQRMSLHTCDTSSTSSDRVDVYDVFSPDERSTRWSEFQELLANSTHEYNSYKIASKNVRGSNKAMTIAGVRPNPNPSAQLPIMH